MPSLLRGLARMEMGEEVAGKVSMMGLGLAHQADQDHQRRGVQRPPLINGLLGTGARAC
jgi:hypothetical protein